MYIYIYRENLLPLGMVERVGGPRTTLPQQTNRRTTTTKQ